MTRGCSILGRPALTLSGRATGLLLALVGTLIDSCEALVVRRMGLYLDDWQQRGQWGAQHKALLELREGLYAELLLESGVARRFDDLRDAGGTRKPSSPVGQVRRMFSRKGGTTPSTGGAGSGT